MLLSYSPALLFPVAAATAQVPVLRTARSAAKCPLTSSPPFPFRQYLVTNELWHIYNSKTIYYICTLLPYTSHSHSTEVSSWVITCDNWVHVQSTFSSSQKEILLLQLVHFNMHVLLFGGNCRILKLYIEIVINKYINFHLYQEAGLYLYLEGKAILFRDSYKNNSWLKRSKKMMTLKVSLIFLEW